MKKIYIIHGWTYTLDAWKSCLEFLHAHNVETVMLNVPGLTEKSEKVWTLDDYVEWLNQALPQYEDITVVGHSNGGRIALAHALKYPGKISQLILIDAAGIVHKNLMLQVKRKVFGVLAKAGKNFTSSPKVRKIFYRLIGARDYERASENMRKTMANLITADLTPDLPKITTKTLIIWGKKDSATPASDAYVMHEAIVGSKLVVIPDTGHSPHMTHPERVAGEIVKFL